MSRSNDDILKDLNSRYSQLADDRGKFEDDWTEVQEYVDNRALSWGSLEAIPQKPNRYSSKPCNYLNILVNGLVGYSISPNIVWFKLGLNSQQLLKEYMVKDWLESVERIMLAKFNSSNLYKEAANMIHDAAVLGHGVIKIDEDIKNERLRYTKLPANEVYLDTNEYGEVDTLFRRYYLTVRNCVEFFGLDKLHAQIKDAYSEVDRWNEKIEILECIMPRSDYNENFKDAKNKPWAVYWIDRRNNVIIDESGYDDFPYAVFYWEKIAGYSYSTSPAQDAMPDVKALNIAKKTSLQIAQTSAEPPMKVSEDIRQVNITPRGFTYVTSADQMVEPIKTGENYPITLEVLSHIEQDIKDWFNVDFFLMLQQKQGKMTATEVMELQGEKAATLANLVVNLNEALLKIIQRSFNILAKAGELPPAPEALRGMGTSIKVDFMGPLAQAQKKYHTMGGIAQAMNLASPIIQLFPNAGDFLDGDELMKSAMEGQGMPANIIREDNDVKKLRQARIEAEKEAQAQAQQQAMLQSVMQNAGNMSKAPEEGSLMQDLNNQLTGSIQR